MKALLPMLLLIGCQAGGSAASHLAADASREMSASDVAAGDTATNAAIFHKDAAVVRNDAGNRREPTDAGGGSPDVSKAGSISNAGSRIDAGTTDAASGGTVSDTVSLTWNPAWPTAAILTGVRDVTTPAVSQAVQLHNDSSTAVMITQLTISGADSRAFRINGATAPFMLAAGADMSISVELTTQGAALPPAPPQNSGGTLLAATLSATSAAGSAQTSLYGLLLTTATHEVTLGQILTTLGFKLNVGLAQNNANPNTGSVQQLPKIEAGTDEVAAPLFRKRGSTSVSLRAVARFSPKGPMPFGWYPAGKSGTRNLVATMAFMPDAQTSDKARMVLPPITGSTDFDPGSGSFGVWVYTDQMSQKYESGGSAANGDYAYSEDAPNSPAGVHRTKVYPLKDAVGTLIAGSYLLAVEEAGNGDYQDYVFVLSNVTIAD